MHLFNNPNQIFTATIKCWDFLSGSSVAIIRVTPNSAWGRNLVSAGLKSFENGSERGRVGLLHLGTPWSRTGHIYIYIYIIYIVSKAFMPPGRWKRWVLRWLCSQLMWWRFVTNLMLETWKFWNLDASKTLVALVSEFGGQVVSWRRQRWWLTSCQPLEVRFFHMYLSQGLLLFVSLSQWSQTCAAGCQGLAFEPMTVTDSYGCLIHPSTICLGGRDRNSGRGAASLRGTTGNSWALDAWASREQREFLSG